MDVYETQLYRFVGARVRERRRSLKLTQAHLAAKVGLLRSSVANIEAGRQRITLHVLYHLCEALNIDVVAALPSIAEVGDSEYIDDRDLPHYPRS
jgi:transcriptional regulator with XRE-family HTH domain